MTNLDSILKSRDITFLTKVHIVKAMVLPIVMHGCESWTIKKGERRRIDAFKLWFWRRLLSLLDFKEVKSVNPKGNQPWIFIGGTETETEAPILWPPDAKNWWFWTVCWRRLLRVPWTARRSNQSNLREINPECSLKGLMLKLKLQYFGHWMRRTDLLEKTLRKDWRWEEKGTTENEMVEWHHWLSGHGFEQALRVGEGQGSLPCYSSWGHKELGMT